MAGRTSYTAPTNGDAPEGPEQMEAIYAHFDALVDATKSTAGSLPGSGFSGQEFLILDSGRKVAWMGAAWGTVGGVLPDPVVVSSSAANTIVATSYAVLPTTVTTTLTLAAPCWVVIEAEAQLFAATNTVSMGVNVSGATTSAPASPQVGATGFVSATVSAAAAAGQRAHKTLQLNAGANVITIHAMRAVSGTQTITGPVLTVTPLRWA